jgi:hypothetical protein
MKFVPVALAALIFAGWLNPASAQALRPEIGKPLQQANELIKAGKGKEALAKVRDADAVANKTPAEQTTIDRMKGAAAQRAGDNATAIQAFEAVFPKVSGAEAAQVAESLAFAYSANKDWARSGQWVQKAQAAGSNSAQLKQLQAYLQSQSGDYAAIARDAGAAVAAAEAAGKRPEEADLLRYADASQRTGNHAAQAVALEKLLVNYPKKDYWNIYLGRLPRKSGFSDRFAIDVLRLRFATGTLTKTDEYMELAQLALQAGLPSEGKAIVDKGFGAGLLGSGAEADRHKRLRDLTVKQEAEARTNIEAQARDAVAGKDGNAMVNVGYALTTLGQADKGIALIEQGIATKALKRPEDAKLRLGMALLLTGKNKSRGVQVLRSLQGSDGIADIGRLWVIQAGQ